MQLSDVRLSVCPIRSPHVAAAGLLLWARKLGDIDRLLHGWRAGGQQQRRHSTARSSKCGQCHVVSLLLFFDPGTQFPGNGEITLCTTKKYKNQAEMNLTPPPPSENSHAVHDGSKMALYR